MNILTSILIQSIISLIYLIPFLFYKFWGKSMIITLVCGMLECRALLSSYLMLYLGYKGLFSSICVGLSSIFFFYKIIKNKNFSDLFVNKEIIYVLFITVIYSTTICILARNANISLLLLILFVPFLETIVCQYIIYKMIPQNISKKIMYIYFIFLSIIIALLHLEFNFISLSYRSVAFFCFYLIRYFYPKTNQLWITVLCHSSYNFVVMLIPILFQGLVK